MPSLDESTSGLSGAEFEFKEAFRRLKEDRPTRLPKGTPISQNNVAKEAGCTASALRKERFPDLVKQIQALVQSSGERSSELISSLAVAKRRNMTLRAEQATQRAKYDLETSRVLSLLAEIAELRRQVASLEFELRGNTRSMR